ncbi:MAG: RNA-binding protein [Eubacterium sp.]|nr:RNA-binding protein [Eubacterium sp.]
MRLGEKQKLIIKRKVDFGVYLSDGEEEVLLPRKQVPEGASEGDEISVFLYKDSSDRLIATVNEPAVTLGHTAVLRVKDVTKIGAFLDWGLEKDLLLPFKEQTCRVKKDDEIVVALYVDKSERLAATMKVYPYLRKDAPYSAGDMVKGRVYEISPSFGGYVAVDDVYSAMIPPSENIESLTPGQVIECRVTMVKEDGKLDLSTREVAYKQMDTDAEAIDRLIDLCGGELPFDDKASPALIKEETGLSKAAFKRAVGRLYKERKIVIGDGFIRRNNEGA